MLNNRLQGNFVSKNVVNLSRRNLKGSEISLLSKGLNFVPTSNTIDKAKLKMESEGPWQNIKINGTLEMNKTSLIWNRLSQNLLSIRVIEMQLFKST